MLAHRNLHSFDVVPLRKLVQNVVSSLASQFAAGAIQVGVDVPSDLTLVGQRELLRRAVENLMLHAADAMPHGGMLVVTAVAGARMIELEVADTGPTMSDDQRRHTFDFMTAADRGQSGWGLAVVRRIAEMHGGSVTVANCPEGGAAFTLKIPRHDALEAAA